MHLMQLSARLVEVLKCVCVASIGRDTQVITMKRISFPAAMVCIFLSFCNVSYNTA